MGSIVTAVALLVAYVTLELHSRHTAFSATKKWCLDSNIALIKMEGMRISRPARVEFIAKFEDVEYLYVLRLSSWFGFRWTAKLESRIATSEIA